MERLFCLIIACLFNLGCFAQLKMAISHAEQQEIEKRQEKARIDSIYKTQQRIHYDSMQAYPKGDAIYGLIGQRIMVKPYKEGNYISNGNVKFFTSPSIVDIYQPRIKSKFNGISDREFLNQSTKYSAVSGRIFTITNVLEYDETKSLEIKNYYDSISNVGHYAYNKARNIRLSIIEEDIKVFKSIPDSRLIEMRRESDSLENIFDKLSEEIRNKKIPVLYNPSKYAFMELTDSKDTIYFMFDKEANYPDFPFNIEGYITKLTELKKKEKYARCICMDDYTGTDFYTGKTIRFFVGQIWQLKEIVIDPKDGDLVELYTNSKGEVYEAPSITFDVLFKTKSESDRIKKKYGEATWKAIMTFTIYKGMSKADVRESWGEPKHINNASYGEQWVYDDKYVYFRNGRVTSWN